MVNKGVEIHQIAKKTFNHKCIKKLDQAVGIFKWGDLR